MIIDITSYLGRWPYWGNPYDEESGDKLVELMDKWRINKSLVIALRGILYNDREGNDVTFAASKRHPDRLIATATVNPVTQKDCAVYVNKCIERGAKMIRLYPFYHGYKLDNDAYALNQIVEQATKLSCPICIPIRIFMNWGQASLVSENVISFINGHPDTTFIVDTFNYSEFYPMLKLAKENEKVYLGTSTLTMYTGIEIMVESIGFNRIMLGTAAPLQYPSCGIVKIKNAEINVESIENILSSNAVKLFKL